MRLGRSWRFDVRWSRALGALFSIGLALSFAAPARPRAAWDANAQRAPTTQGYDLETFAAELKWRAIGPFRGGRTKAITGVPSQPNVFYTAAVNGGVWKTDDFGRTWRPIFDDQPTGSVGSIAVAPSDPNVVYVG